VNSVDGVRIVPMRQAHLEALAEIEQLSFSKPWSFEALRAELGNETAHFFAAEARGSAIGYIGLHTVCGEGYIANIAVHPGYRRKGIARTLLEHVKEYARQNSLSFLTLEVRPGNEPAVALYRSEGFLEAGRRRDFYSNPREDALILTLKMEQVGEPE